MKTFELQISRLNSINNYLKESAKLETEKIKNSEKIREDTRLLSTNLNNFVKKYLNTAETKCKSAYQENNFEEV